jgi:hypothetical protein
LIGDRIVKFSKGSSRESLNTSYTPAEFRPTYRYLDF